MAAITVVPFVGGFTAHLIFSISFPLIRHSRSLMSTETP